MQTDTIEERLRRLEACHGTDGAKDSGFPCKAAELAEAHVQELGSLHNDLDEAVHELDRADREKEKRLGNLEKLTQKQDERINSINEQVNSCKAKLHDLEPSGKQSSVPSEMDTDILNLTRLEERQAIHQSRIASLNKAVAELQASGAASGSVSLISTHQIAQALIQRLNGGDVLNTTDLRQLQAALLPTGPVSTLESGGRFPDTPALTDVSTEAQVPLKRKRGRPARLSQESRSTQDSQSSHDTQSTYEPPVKRPRGRPARSSSDSTTSEEAPVKRRPGRPTRAFVVSATSEEPPVKRQPGRPARIFLDSATSDEPPVKRLRNRPPRVAQASTDSDGQTDVDPADEDAHQGDDAGAAPTTSQNDAVGNDTVVDAPMEEVNTTTPEATPEETVCHPVTEPRPPESKEDERITTPPVQESVAGNVDVEMHAAEEGEETFPIPPERRSGRTPKPARTFGDMVTWKEANQQVKSLRMYPPNKKAGI